MRRTALLVIGLLALAQALASCKSAPPPNGQVVLYVDTDAPLPVANGEPPVPPLFDSLRVDVFPPGATDPCDGCTRVIPMVTETVAAGNASLGIATRPGVDGYRVRVRLFRVVATQDGEPNADSTIDVTAALPAVGTEGITECSLVLQTDDVAAPVGSLDQPIDVSTGRLSQGHPGTWPGAQRVSCAGEARPGEVCVPGGAYWMGNPFAAQGFGIGAAANLQRLVVLSPFFLDAHEVTVKDFRDGGGDASGVGGWSGSQTGASLQDWCTYSAQPSAGDGQPLNCVTSSSARTFCRARGADLPSEAQFEYVAGGLESAFYPWGNEDPVCGEATFGLGGLGVLQLTVGTCRAPSSFGGPLPPLRARSDRDQLALPGGTVLDLAGNLGEWMQDAWDEQDGPCWGTGVFTDPVCRKSASRATPARGGNWADAPVALRAAHRQVVDVVDGMFPQYGFRCARPDG